MSDILPHRLVLLPGAVEREEEQGKPTPEEAVGRVLAGNPHAPGLLSRARYYVGAVRITATTAHQAARACRDAELEYEHIRREHDQGRTRNLHFWLAAGLLVTLAGLAGAIVAVMAWHIARLDRVGLAVAAVLLGAAMAAGVSRRRHAAVRFGLAGLVMCVILVVLSVLWSAGPLLPRVGEAIAFGLALAAAGVATVLALDHAEGWCCYKKRRAYQLAARRREDLVKQISLEEATAEEAVGAWVSLVVEECQLGPARDADTKSWVDVCAAAARWVAIPG